MKLAVIILILLVQSCWSARSTEEDDDDLTQCPKGSIVKVTQSNGRVTKVVAHIYKKNLDTGSEPTAKIRSFKDDYGCESDDAGHIIANRLGGCGNAAANIFPQDPRINRGEFRSVEAKVADAVKDLRSSKDYIRYTVELGYSSAKKTRPHVVYYRIQRVEEGEKPVQIARSWVPNPKGKGCVRTA